VIIDFLAALLGRRLPDRYVGRHRATEPVAAEDESPIDLRVEEDDTVVDGGPAALLRPSTPL